MLVWIKANFLFCLISIVFIYIFAYFCVSKGNKILFLFFLTVHQGGFFLGVDLTPLHPPLVIYIVTLAWIYI
jgi:hypothetical protein